MQDTLTKCFVAPCLCDGGKQAQNPLSAHPLTHLSDTTSSGHHSPVHPTGCLAFVWRKNSPLRWSQACQRFSRVRKVQHLSCLPSLWLWCSHRTPGTIHPGNWCCFNFVGLENSSSLIQSTQLPSLGSEAEGPSGETEEVSPGHQPCQQVTGRRGVHRFLPTHYHPSNFTVPMFSSSKYPTSFIRKLG